MNEKNEKIISLDKQKTKLENKSLGNLLPTLLSTFAKDLKPKLITFFESLDDILFDLAEKAESNQKQTLYFESMRNIRKSRSQMLKEFFVAIQTCFKKFKKNELNYFSTDKTYNSETKALSLSLIDEKELDESLATTNLINKSEMAFHRNLFALEKRFSLLASGTELKASQIPMGPYVIVNAFNQCLKPIEMDITVKLILYKLFERNVMGQLNPIYSNINKFLANEGIISEIKYQFGNNNSAQVSQTQDLPQQSSEQSSIQPPDNQIQNMPENPQNNVDENYNTISQYFTHNNSTTNENSVTNHAPRNGSQAANVDMSSLMNALSILQSDVFRENLAHPSSHSVVESPTEIKDRLIKQLHELDSNSIDKKVNKHDEDTIDLVGMLFQFIVDDRNLPETMQVLLAKLQIPYLKIALQDRNLFADKSHPARLMLDKLSLACVGWTKESDRNNALLNKTEEITKLILDMDEYQEETFTETYEDFSRFTAKLKKKSDVLQKRTKEKTKGLEKINNAKEEVAQLLVDKMTNQKMPILIRDILLGEWSNVLVLLFLRHENNSKEYTKKLNFVDEIIAVSQVNPDTVVNKKNIKKIADLYESGIKLVAYNPKEVIDKTHKLVECLYEVHDLNSKNSDDGAAEDVEYISSDEILKISEIRKQEHEITEFIQEIIEPSELQKIHEDIQDKYFQIVEKLKSGNWLEFKREESDSVRAKLSWISPITGKYLFVNSRGLKVTDKTKLGLAAGLREKSITVLQQVALFDRALSAIATQLKADDNENKIDTKTEAE